MIAGALIDLTLRLRAMLARGLNLNERTARGEWLLRLFFRPARAGARDWPAQFSAWLGRRGAERLGIGEQHNLGMRLWRLFVRPPRSRRRLAAPTRRRSMPEQAPPQSALRRWLDQRLEPAYRLVARKRRRLAARLPQIDWMRAGSALAHLAALAHRVRGMAPAMLMMAGMIGLVLCTTPLPLSGQLTVFALVWLAVMVLRRIPGHFPTLAMMALSVLMTLRYIWWRATETLNLDTPLEVTVGYLLFAAEAYTWLILILGYVQTAWPLSRRPKTLPADPAQWPTVDVYIPTYNEPLSVVQPTVYAARSLDWPSDKLNVYLLDDGRRAGDPQAFAEEAGVHYLTRSDNRHAKAGNLNHALTVTDGEYIAIFDCDHIPTRSFLQTTMGWFLARSAAARWCRRRTTSSRPTRSSATSIPSAACRTKAACSTG